MSLPVKIDNRTIQMEVDTGTAVSCISKATYCKYFSDHRIESSEIMLNFYDGSKIKPLGIIKPNVSVRNINKQLELLIIDGGTTSFLGDHTQMSTKINDLIIRYKELFNGGLGRFTGGKAHLRVREGAASVFHLLDAALDDTLAEGVMEPVELRLGLAAGTGK